MEIEVMEHNWEESKRGNTVYSRALNGDEIKFYHRSCENSC
jgi:hypothetical protein